MIPNNLKSVQTIGNNQGEIRLGLDQNAVAHLIGVLTDLYSDPVKAVVREYSTNARDSHIDSGNEAPIQVTTPTAFNPFFTVQDFGLGLNVDDLTNVYSLYGHSTKRDSDAVNGVLGLGCKCALTYALSFNVTAVKGGVKTLATIVKDEDGVGTIKILDTSATDEANGVTIAVPVRERDFRRFAEIAADFYKYWDEGTVVVNGEPAESIRNEAGWLWLDEDVAVKNGHGNSFIVQNNVAYPVSSDQLGVQGAFQVVAYVLTGTVNFPPNREALQYTSLTKATLATLSEYVSERLPQAIEKLVDSKSSTPWDRLQIINEYRRFAPELAKRLVKDYGQGPTTPLGREIITFNPSAYRRKSSKQTGITWWQLFDHHTRTTIVTGFPVRSLSIVARERLETLETPTRDFILLPEGTALTGLTGRENVITWESVVEATEIEQVKAKAERSIKKRTKTTYTIGRNGTIEFDAVVVSDGSPVVYAVKIPKDRWGYQRDHVALAKYAREAQVVELRSNQVAKFLRENDDAVTLEEYVAAKREIVRNALTAEDALLYTVQSHCTRIRLFTALSDEADEVLDDELAYLLLILQAPRAATLVEALALDVTPEPNAELVHEVEARYPLITNQTYNTPVEDILLYVNAKFTSLHTTV